MKNMTLRNKLISGFILIALMIVVGGFIGSYGIYQTEKALKEVNDVRLPAVNALASLRDAQTALVLAERSLLVPENLAGEETKNRLFTYVASNMQLAQECMQSFDALPKSPEQAASWKDVKTSWNGWKTDLDQFIEMIRSGRRDEALALSNNKMRDSALTSVKYIQDLIALNTKEAKANESKTEVIARVFKYLALVGSFGGAFLALAFGIFFPLMITRPINRVIEGLGGGAEQVVVASTAVASASQSLAEGASEQAASLEETSSSLEEMAAMTQNTADNASQAKALMLKTREIVSRVNDHVGQMAVAVSEATTTSEETGKIIKTIDEIAFQTNLLALNAAVEAARAGEAGAGFAVVADEVRNLAMRAAEAARTTSTLIENTVTAVRKSSELTQMTQEAFRENVEISGKVGNLIDEIAATSQEQSGGILQVNKAVAEMDRVVQQIAANAEQSASAAEQMHGQSEIMKSHVDQLVCVIEGQRSRASSQP